MGRTIRFSRCLAVGMCEDVDECENEGRRGVFIVMRKDCDMFDSKLIVSGGNDLFQMPVRASSIRSYDWKGLSVLRRDSEMKRYTNLNVRP